jgi:hypothetical protein
MTFTLEPAAAFAQPLNHLIIKATFNPANEWFFFDGAHSGANVLEQGMSNTWLHENFAAVSESKEIISYFEGQWQRPLDIINGFRTINFKPDAVGMSLQIFLAYIDYLFVNRGCLAFNWTAALQNEHALEQYECFIKDCCGRRVGIRHHARKSYTGKISDVNLYELIREEYFDWKGKNFRIKS